MTRVLPYLLGRVLYALSVLLGVTGFAFGVVHLAGDPLAALVPAGSSPAQREALRRGFGLDRSLPEQYGRFLGRAVRGDFGESWRQRRSALDAVLDPLPATLALTGLAVLLAVLVGGALGLLAGTRPGGVADAGVRGLALLGQALPGFWLGTLLILLFAVRLRWLPPSGLDGPRSLVLPAVALAAAPAAAIARLLRAALIEAIGADHVRTARGKGIAPAAVLRRHVLRGAALPTLAYVGLQVGFLLGGAVVVEAVFAYPGVGRLALGAVADRDLPVVQAVVVVLATLIVGTNLLVDLLARWLDPRVGASAAGTGGGG